MQRMKHITLLLILSLVALTAYCSRNNDKNIESSTKTGEIDHSIINEQANTDLIDAFKETNNSLTKYDRNQEKEYKADASPRLGINPLGTVHIPKFTSFDISRDSISVIIDDNKTAKAIIYRKLNRPYTKANQKTGAPNMETDAKGVSIHSSIAYDLLSVLVPLGVLMLIIFFVLPLYFCKK